MRTAMIGCGEMGAPIVGRLLSEGHEVYVYDQLQGATALLPRGATVCLTPREATQLADIVFVCLPSDEEVRTLIWNPSGGILNSLGLHTILINLSTVSAKITTDLERAGQVRGFRYLAAPLSGTAQDAVRANLTVFLGGNERTCVGVLPVLRAFARHTIITGTAETAIVSKLAADSVRYTVIAGLSEALVVGIRAGVSVRVLTETITRTCGYAQIEQDIRDLLTADSAGIVDTGLRHKDLDLLRQLRQKLGITSAQAPVGPFIQQLFKEARLRHGYASPLAFIIALTKATGAVLRPRPEPESGPDPGHTGLTPSFRTLSPIPTPRPRT